MQSTASANMTEQKIPTQAMSAGAKNAHYEKALHYLKLANQYQDQWFWEQASLMFDKAIHQDKDNADAYFQLAVLITTNKVKHAKYDEYHFLEKAAKLNHGQALFELGLYLMEGTKGPESFQLGLDYLKQSANLKYGKAIHTYACALTNDYYGKDQTSEAIAWFNTAITQARNILRHDSEDKDACKLLQCGLYDLANLYLSQGNNQSKAICLLTEASELGMLQAEGRLNLLLSENFKTETQPEKKAKLAKLWWERLHTLAKKEFGTAEYNLGYCYYYGITEQSHGIQAHDIELGKKYLLNAVLHQNASAALMLANIYKRELMDDESEAMLKIAADLGSPEAQLLYGSILCAKVSSPNMELASQYLKKAADYPNTEAQFTYAICCLSQWKEFGNDNKKHPLMLEAIKYFDKAANNLHPEGMLYAICSRINGDVVNEGKKETLLIAHQLLVKLAKCKCTPQIYVQIESLTVALAQKFHSIDFPENNETSTDSSISSKKKTRKKQTTPKNNFPIQIKHKFTVFKPDVVKEPEAIESKSVLTEAIVLAPTVCVPPVVKKKKRKKDKRIKIKVSESQAVTLEETSSARSSNPSPQPNVILPDDVKHWLTVFKDAGYAAYAVGGFTRDLLRNKDSNDVDIVTDAPAQVISQITKATANPHIPNLYRFFQGKSYDVTQVENLSSAADLLKDALKRDFTVNALYIDVDGQVCDPTQRGLTDLHANDLNTILPPDESFAADYFRLLRYANFLNSGFNANYEPGYIQGKFKDLKKQIESIGSEINSEVDSDKKILLIEKKSNLLEKLDIALCKVFLSGNAANALKILITNGFMKEFFPSMSHDAHTQSWLALKFQAFDRHNLITKPKLAQAQNTIYGLLLAAMLKEKDAKAVTYCLTTNPFPVNLRWQLNTDDVLQKFSERMIYSEIPDALRKQFEHQLAPLSTSTHALFTPIPVLDPREPQHNKM